MGSDISGIPTCFHLIVGNKAGKMIIDSHTNALLENWYRTMKRSVAKTFLKHYEC